jgi:hypothetical protein
MWYKYVNRADYDSIRIWRYLGLHLESATSSSTQTTTV